MTPAQLRLAGWICPRECCCRAGRLRTGTDDWSYLLLQHVSSNFWLADRRLPGDGARHRLLFVLDALVHFLAVYGDVLRRADAEPHLAAFHSEYGDCHFVADHDRLIQPPR